MIKSFSRTARFWAVFIILCAGCLWFSIRYFAKAMPIANVAIAMSRTQAIEKAQQIATTLHIGPTDAHTAASFETDYAVQKFVELEGGGSPAFNAMITGTLYSPYTWHARLFKEHEANEVTFIFKSDGTPYGFVETIAEQTPGAALTAVQAREIAESTAEKQWLINFADYIFVEASQEKRPNGRVDHQFTYERSGISIGGEGKYRLTLAVVGDKLTQVKHLIKIPEGFYRRFSEIRATNDTIAQLATTAFWILYLLLGCYVGFLILARERRLLLRPALLCALFLAILQSITPLNDLPQAWMNYDTSMSSRNFLFDYFVDIITGFLRTFIMILLPAAAVAEALTRKAFGHHLQFWRLLSSPIAGSLPVLGRVVGGYLMVTIDLAMLTLTYLVARTFFGWWMPSDPMVDPNILASYFPWVSAAARSLYAGFWEELVFRAVPLASAALIGERLGKRNLFIVLGMVVQALIFGAAHADYPMLPGYARVVELFIPSLVFGFLYLRFGLLVPILAHATYDLVLMAMPLFMTSAPGAWVNQSLAIAWGLIPLFIVLVSYFRAGHWRKLSADAYNSSWHPEVEKAEIHHTNQQNHRTSSTRTAWLLFALAIVAAGVALRWTSDEPPLTITSAQAIEKAKSVLAKQGIQLSDEWKVFALVDDKSGLLTPEAQFAWQTGGHAAYHELLHKRFIWPPLWIVRFAKFTGDIQERAEEYDLYLNGQGNVMGYYHRYPENRAIESLNQDDARAQAITIIKAQYGIDRKHLEEVSARSEKHPARTDWSFIFSVPTQCPLPEGQARISVTLSGNQLSNCVKYMHVPEHWSRTYTNNKTFYDAIERLGKGLLAILLIAVALYALSTVQCSWTVFWKIFLTIFTLGLALLINKLPEIQFTLMTSKPFINQMVVSLLQNFIPMLIQASSSAVIITWISAQWTGILQLSSALIACTIGIAAAIGPHILRNVGTLAHIPALYPLPWWASYTSSDPIFPWLGAAGSELMVLVSISSSLFALLTLVRLIGKQHALLTLLPLLIYGFAMIGHPDSLLFWGAQGLLLSILLIAGYWLLGSNSLKAIPIGVASFITAKSVQMMVLNAFPGAMLGYAIGIGAVWLLVYLFCLSDKK